ncbi:histidine kinase [Mucilaginibacter sp. cycad4]|uniref:sensor histidine kinase n=1 Tax=Mucilaginibacter sp. cycad4 TaxID=3342096 RepID=UPI002AAC114F|nr:histidine kinase [Mucilaginibacter gossypii]WPV00632.1 histidine kinase [Mucilaginibacter gossypii]
MPSPLPIKSLIRLNWLLVSTFTAIISLYFIFLLDEAPLYKVFYMAMTALGISLVAFVNVRILILLARKYSARGKVFRRYRYFFTYTASAAAYVMLAPAFDYIEHKSNLFPFPVYLIIFLVSGILVNTVIVLLQDFVILQADKAHADLELSQIKTAHAEATNLLLKQQIHPHFLFNALNTLKALYRKDPCAGDNYIVHLANFLRASVYNHAAKTSSLADELALLLDYLEMQKIRFGSALNCIIDLPADILNDRYLPSFSLQPLLENAIKHNELTQQSPLIINIFCSEDRIVVSNTLKKKNLNVTSTYHGLANLAERYSLLSGDEVIINENANTFSVSIRLLNNEYSDHRG